MLFIVTGLFGAVQPIWICCYKCAVDIHLKHARTRCDRSHIKWHRTEPKVKSQFTCASRPNLKAWSDNRISDDLLLGSNLERDTLLSIRHLGGSRIFFRVNTLKSTPLTDGVKRTPYWWWWRTCPPRTTGLEWPPLHTRQGGATRADGSAAPHSPRWGSESPEGRW